MTDVAACPNVVLKLGGIGMPVFGMGWHKRPGGATAEQLAEAWGEPIRWCIEQFGVDRCMFESNFPVDKVVVQLRHVVGGVRADLGRRQRRRRTQALYHDTAVRTYRI